MTIGTSVVQHGAVKPSNLEQEVFDTKVGAYRYIEVPSNLQLKVEYNASGTAKYRGYAVKGLAAGTDGWLIQFLEYDANNRLTTRTIAYGNWTNRAAETYS